MNCCENILKTALFPVNLLIFLCGAAIVTAGAVAHVYLANYDVFMEGQVVASSIVLIAVGVLVVLVAFLGCCGACVENSCMMKTYGALLLVFFICEIGIGVAAYVYKGDVQDWIKDEMNTTIANYGEPEFESVTTSWDIIQPSFGCCGVESYKDWTNGSTTLKAHKAVPASCCKNQKAGEENPNCGYNMTNKTKDEVKDDIYTEGCFSEVKDDLKSDIAIVGGAAIGIAVLQLIVSIVAFFLGRRMSQENQYA